MTTLVHIVNAGPQRVSVRTEEAVGDHNLIAEAQLAPGQHCQRYVHAQQTLRIVETKEPQA